MELRINNYIITEPIENIIYELKQEAKWQALKTVNNKGNYLQVTCPFHKDGNENRPSCSIFIDYNSDSVVPGTFHCFTCDTKGPLYKLVAQVLNLSDDLAKEWLIERWGNLTYTVDTLFKSWDILKPQQKGQYLDESILDQYKYYHPYIESRKISFEVAKRFLVGYNKDKDTITFPIWDEFGHLVMITERSTISKKFYIPEGIEKPVYLLNFILDDLKNGIKYPYVMITEGQIDALTAWSYGMPCVATCGSISEHQINVLKNSGITTFITMFDNDAAGNKFAQVFAKNIGIDKFVTNIDINLPSKKDINDLSKAEFDILLKNKGIIVK